MLLTLLVSMIIMMLLLIKCWHDRKINSSDNKTNANKAMTANSNAASVNYATNATNKLFDLVVGADDSVKVEIEESFVELVD